MESIATLTLGDIVRHNYKAAAVLEKFGLDFCCRGYQKLNEACRAADIEPSIVIEELGQIQNERPDTVDFNTCPLDLLVDYICKHHHIYVEEKTPVIKAYLDKIAKVHSPNHPELKEVRDIFFEIGGELTVHMKKEELMLFPFIKKLELVKATGVAASDPLVPCVEKRVEMMMDDHAIEGEKFRKINFLTNHYQLPADACTTYSLAYQLLEEYEKDLHRHIHLENNILFPRAVALEAKLTGIDLL